MGYKDMVERLQKEIANSQNSKNNMTDKDLTILLILKDRTSLTWRWMHYANQIKLPFKILIADGGRDKEVEKLVDKSLFPNIDYEYIRYPYDQTLSMYYEKVAHATTLVKTPFVVQTGNNDFLSTDGLRKATNFLKKHPDYSTARGVIYQFGIKPNDNDWTGQTYGQIINLTRLYDHANSITDEMAIKRLHNHCATSWCSLYHDIHRTEKFRKIYQSIKDINPNNLIRASELNDFYTIASGKVFRGPYFFMIHQGNTLESNSKSIIKKFFNPFDWILEKEWLDEFDKFLNIIATIASQKDNISSEDATEKIKNSYMLHALGKRRVGQYVDSNTNHKNNTGGTISGRIQSLLHKLDRENLFRRKLRQIYILAKTYQDNLKTKKLLNVSDHKKDIGLIKDFLAKKPEYDHK